MGADNFKHLRTHILSKSHFLTRHFAVSILKKRKRQYRKIYYVSWQEGISWHINFWADPAQWLVKPARPRNLCQLSAADCRFGAAVVALLNDRQCGLAPTATLVFAEAKHAFCQAHYLNNVAEPVAEADQSLKASLRQGVRRETGYLAGASSGCGLD